MYYPAVMIAAWYGGFWPGVLTTALSALAATYRYLAPAGSFSIHDASDAIALALFVINGVIVARVGEYVRRAGVDQQKLASIVESSDDAIVGKSLEGVITSWNRGAQRLLGYSAEEAIGRPIAILIPPDRMREEEQVLASIRAGRRVEPFETIRVQKGGTLVDVSVTVSPIVARTGAIVGASKIARDIGERKRAERQRDELIDRERLAHEEGNAARDRLAFLADVGTVLTSSLDYQETLDRAVHLALPRFGDYCTVFVQDEHGVLR
jgi:PAS domain S-box-containing protein